MKIKCRKPKNNPCFKIRFLEDKSLEEEKEDSTVKEQSVDEKQDIISKDISEFDSSTYSGDKSLLHVKTKEKEEEDTNKDISELTPSTDVADSESLCIDLLEHLEQTGSYTVKSQHEDLKLYDNIIRYFFLFIVIILLLSVFPIQHVIYLRTLARLKKLDKVEAEKYLFKNIFDFLCCDESSIFYRIKRWKYEYL